MWFVEEVGRGITYFAKINVNNRSCDFVSGWLKTHALRLNIDQEDIIDYYK